MLRMLQDFLPLFQRFPISPKTPCNMTATYVLVIDVGAYYGVSRSFIFRCLKEIAPERRRPDGAINYRFMLLARDDGAYANSRRTDRLTVNRLLPSSRKARVDLLGVGDLRDRRVTPRHRPPGIDTPLLRDRIVALNTDPAKLGVTRQDTVTTGDNRGSTQGD